MGKYKDMPGIRILEETMRIAVGNGKRALLFLLTRPLGHSLEYRMWKGDLQKMLKISEFSKLSHLTIKALRFYEKEGLLKPASVDEWNKESEEDWLTEIQLPIE